MSIWNGPFFKRVYELSKSDPATTRSNNTGPTAKSIETLTLADFNARFDDIARHALPVVVKNYFPILDIEIIKERLITQLSGKDFVMRTGDYSAPENYIDKRETIQTSIAYFINNELFSSNKNYLGNNEIDITAINCLSNYPAVRPLDLFLPPALWLGPVGAITPMHKDSSDNFAHILYGKKQWLLVPVTEAKKMRYQRASRYEHSEFTISPIDFRERDNFLKLAITYFDVVTEAGDLLYLPMGWGHIVSSITPCIMVNYWLDPTKAPPGILSRIE